MSSEVGAAIVVAKIGITLIIIGQAGLIIPALLSSGPGIFIFCLALGLWPLAFYESPKGVKQGSL